MTDSDTLVLVFTYTPGRGSRLADKLFDGMREGAVLMTDGYTTYDGIAQRHRLIHLASLTHARRGFVRTEDNAPKAARTPGLLATRFIKLIDKLFIAEARSQTWKAERLQCARARLKRLKPMAARPCTHSNQFIDSLSIEMIIHGKFNL